jgi:hypothetical protein
MSHRPRQAALPVAEILESRQLLAASVAGTTLNIDGTTGNDKILIGLSNDGNSFKVTIGTKAKQFAKRGIKTINANGGLGNDTINVLANLGKIKININGGDGNDLLQGNASGESFNGGLGDDTVNAGAGNDKANGGDGNDFITGSKGNDVLKGDAGNDEIYGDEGNDKLYGGDGDDVMGGDDENTLRSKPLTSGGTPDVFGNDLMDGGNGNDMLLGGVSPTLFANGQQLTAFPDKTGQDTFTGGAGPDFMYLWGSGADADTITDEAAEDVVPSKEFPHAVDPGPTHTHAFLRILLKTKKGQKELVIPPGVGYFVAGLAKLHTHLNDTAGRIHFESGVANDTYFLGDFFNIWGINFSSHAIGRYVATSKKPITMKVNGVVNTQFGDYQPHDLDHIDIIIG